jgi:dolichol kinase
MVGGVLPIRMLPFGSHCKSWGGFLGFFVTTLCVLLILYYPLGSSIIIILAISLVLSFAEMVSFNGTDNLVVPIAAALLSMLLL